METLETLAAIKNPPVVVARQANVTSGPQQINNGVAAPAHARTTESEPNKLLEAERGEWVDIRAASAAIESNSALVPVGTLYGAKNGQG